MNSSITIVEKPDWVSWEDIKQCLVDAHAINRAAGINMTHYQWPAEKIKDSVENNGTMLVALDGEKVVGTAAIVNKQGRNWYVPGQYAYMCYAAVLPEYSGQGIYKALIKKREEIAREKHFDILLLDTHYENKRIQEIAKKNDYRYVQFLRARSKDHYSVVMVKWLSGCPYSRLFCFWKYTVSKIKTIISGGFRCR